MPVSNFFNPTEDDPRTKFNQQTNFSTQQDLNSQTFLPTASQQLFNAFQNNPRTSYGQANQWLQALQGNINVTDNTGKFSIQPSGNFQLSNQNFNINVDPRTKSFGVNTNQPWGTVGLQATANQFNPSIQATFEIANPKTFGTPPEQSVNAALSPYATQTKNLEDNRDVSPKDFLNQQITKYRQDNPNWYMP